MNMQEIKQKAETMNYEQAVLYIQSLPLNISLIRDMEIERLWRVENNSEIDYISVSYKSFVSKMAQVGIIPKI